MKFIPSLVYFLAKLCQNIPNSLGIRGGFTQSILRSRNIAFLQTKSESTQESIPLLAKYTLSTGIDWKLNITNNKILFHNDITYYSQREDWPQTLWDPEQTQRYPNRKNSFTDAFFVLNSSMQYAIKQTQDESLHIALYIYNLLDEVYYTQNITVPSAQKEAFWDMQYDQRKIDISLTYNW